MLSEILRVCNNSNSVNLNQSESIEKLVLELMLNLVCYFEPIFFSYLLIQTNVLLNSSQDFRNKIRSIDLLIVLVAMNVF